MTTPRKPSAIGIGLVALDVVSGGVNHIERAGLYAGGTCGNVLTVLSFLGWGAAPVARLADDAAGRAVRNDMRAFNVDLRLIGLEPRARTPIVGQRIRVDESGSPRHTFSWTCAECGSRFPGFYAVTLASAESVIEHRPQTHTVYFCDRPSPAAVRLAEHFRERGAIVIFEAAGVGVPSHFRAMLELAHIVKYSHETQKVLDILRSDNPATAFLEIETLSAEGLRYIVRRPHLVGTWRTRSAFEAPRLRDTSGAGDWCTAGIIDALCRRGLPALLRSKDAEIAAGIDAAQSLSAWNCAFEGARGGMYGVSSAKVKKLAAVIRQAKVNPAVPELNAGAAGPPRFCDACASPPLKNRSAPLFRTP